MNNDPDKGYDEHIDNMILEKQIEESKEMTKEKVEELSQKIIWETLRAVDCSDIEYKKGSLTYIGWADLWARLMDIFPQSDCVYDEPVFYGEPGNQTCEVTCTLYIGKFAKSVTFPVMAKTGRMESIVNPTTRDISDARQRGLAKVMGMWGLGLYLWERKTYESKTDLGSDEMPF